MYGTALLRDENSSTAVLTQSQPRKGMIPWKIPKVMEVIYICFFVISGCLRVLPTVTEKESIARAIPKSMLFMMNEVDSSIIMPAPYTQ